MNYTFEITINSLHILVYYVKIIICILWLSCLSQVYLLSKFYLLLYILSENIQNIQVDITCYQGKKFRIIDICYQALHKISVVYVQIL